MADQPNKRRKTKEQVENHRNYMRPYMQKKREIKKQGQLERLAGYEQCLTEMLPDILQQRANLTNALTKITENIAKGSASKEDLKILNTLLKDQQYWLDRVDPVVKKLEVDSRHTSVDVARLLEAQGSEPEDDNVIDVDVEGSEYD